MGIASRMERKNGGANEENTTAVSKKSYVNKQRVLVFASRGISTRNRHFLDDIRKMLPHHKKDVKLDAKDNLHEINDIADIKGCNSTIFLETRKRQDLYMWVSSTPVGPSIKFHVQNVHTMEELKMTGNSLAGSRPILSFDKAFDDLPHLSLIKSMFINTWGTPKGHPKVKPFIDRIMSFFYADHKIWCRTYQIADEADTKKLEASAAHKGEDLTNLIEIGPRFVLTPIRIFDGSFGGQTIYHNEKYISPNSTRQSAKSSKHDKYVSRKQSQKSRATRKEENVLPYDELSEVFH